MFQVSIPHSWFCHSYKNDMVDKFVLMDVAETGIESDKMFPVLRFCKNHIYFFSVVSIQRNIYIYVVFTYMSMKIKVKIAKFGKHRRIVEIPKAVRDNFKIGEIVIISKEAHK